MLNNGCEEIGGYFELELNQNELIYNNFLTLNSARNCLVFLIKAKQIKELHLPYYNCDVVKDAVRRFCPETRIHLYHVNDNFEPISEDFSAEGYLYYVNYYGLQDHLIQSLSNYHLIVDNAQAFYSAPIVNSDFIYCPRKFFGVSDGGYLSTNALLVAPLEEDTSWQNAVHLLKRIDCSASAAYIDFQAADRSLNGRPLKQMSRLTKRVLSSIDHVTIRNTRSTNFTLVHSNLSIYNEMSSTIEHALASNTFIPFCYPFKTQNAEMLRARLIENKIYVPIYWPELRNSTDLNQAEQNFVNKIVCLPIDQRYGKADMENIINVICE